MDKKTLVSIVCLCVSASVVSFSQGLSRRLIQEFHVLVLLPVIVSFLYCPLGGAHLLMDPFSVIDIMNNVTGGQTPPNVDKTS